MPTVAADRDRHARDRADQAARDAARQAELADLQNLVVIHDLYSLSRFFILHYMIGYVL
jgi:hypothetical protein